MVIALILNFIFIVLIMTDIKWYIFEVLVFKQTPVLCYQANQIMSITCDNNAAELRDHLAPFPDVSTDPSGPDTEEESVSSTPSSSPLVSAATSVSTPPATPTLAPLSEDQAE